MTDLMFFYIDFIKKYLYSNYIIKKYYRKTKEKTPTSISDEVYQYLIQA